MDNYKVNKDVCIGCGFCANVCPQAFRLNADEKAECYAKVNAGDTDSAEDALSGCPVNAIYKE